MSSYNQYNETPVLRDVQVAQEIRSMAALGKFPQEITAYGLVYYKNGRRQYMISADPSRLIFFLNEPENRAYFPTPIDSYSERLAIPEGYEADVVQSIKLKLARKLQRAYPEEAFVLLRQLSGTPADQSAEPLLLAYRDRLEGVFQAGRIRAFAMACTKAYLRKNVSKPVYEQLTDWCARRQARLERYIPPSSDRERAFYGLAVLREHKIAKCVCNANLNCIYEEKLKLEQEEGLVTAWHRKVFAVGAQENLRAIRSRMEAALAEIYDAALIDLLEKLDRLPGVIGDADLQRVLERLRALGAESAALGVYYGREWGVWRAAAEEANHGGISVSE